ncbi:MAG TPA: hypothetical protein VGO00_11195 [Kofleriaceae bacterium]|jgi:hypothetical protein|nr:hypothetical protein [Kofleriaceae bacterium]
MSRAATVLAVGLAASVAVNVYLIVTRPTETEPASSPAQSASRTSPVASLGTPSGRSDPARTALEAKLVETEAELDKHRPLAEKYELADRSPEVEAQVKPFLDKIFPAGPKPGYMLECHGRVCRLEADADRDHWMEPLQQDPDGRGLFHGMTFDRYATYLDVEPPDRVAGNRYLRAVFDLVRHGPELAACKKQFPAAGSVSYQLTLDPSRHVVIATTGPLAGSELDRCSRDIVDRVIAGMQPPADVSAIPDWTLMIEVP